MSDISVKIPPEQLSRLHASLDEKQLSQAVYQAVLRTTRAAAGIIRRTIQESLALDGKYVKRVVTTQTRGDGVDVEGHVLISQESVPLIAYMDRRVGKSGITVVITKGRLPVYFRHAFYAAVGTPRGGAVADRHKGIFFRAQGRDSSGKLVTKETYRSLRTHAYEGGRLTASGYARRLPIEEAMGPSVADAIGVQNLTELGQRVVASLEATLAKYVDSQISRFTQGQEVGAADDGSEMEGE